MGKTRGGSWISRSDVGMVRRITWATALIVVLTLMMLMTATWLPAQEAPTRSSLRCASAVRGTLVASAALSAAATGVELQGMTRTGSWHTMDQGDAMQIAADPSSHLHALGSYHLARSATSAFAGCQGRSRAALSGAAWALAVGVSKEIVDGWYTGFSTVDLAVDAAGVGYALAQTHVPALRHITPTFSVSPRALRSLSSARGAMTDYANQTAWLSANVHELLPSKVAGIWPSAMRLSVGRRTAGGATGSQYIVGLDLDAERLPGTNPTWMRLKSALHHARLPGPAIVMGSGGTKAFGLYW
jgi:hypothetical protein